jgi:N-acyl-D-aspartate/D-glutamate deacylase
VSALWSTNDTYGQPLDAKYSTTDFSTKALQLAQSDVDMFKTKAGKLIEPFDETTVAHDFWLTRNYHGAGFWDGDYPELVGRKLTQISKELGQRDIYVGDDGKLHFL